MSNTQENLEAAFAGESQANRKYLFFAEKADNEGNAQIARLFRAAAESETVHARNHLEVMGGIGATADNLKEGINGESYEFTKMYPDFLEDAKEEGKKAGVIVMVYDHDVKGLEDDLIESQHHHRNVINSVLHVHLSDRECLEAVAVKGDAEDIRKLAQELTTKKGVKQVRSTIISP